MRKRTISVISACVILLVAAGVIIYITTRTTVTPSYWAKAKATPATVACLATNPKVAISQDTRNTIELAALSYLIDVPAGTNVDIKLATYSPTSVTGSDRYPSKYGSYNFAMAKQSDGWHVTDFKRCY